MATEHRQPPSWSTIGLRGLTGNILVTGSIGSGKTQGTMLSYLDQLAGNLSKCPSLLAIDPKRSFVKEARSILEEHKYSKRIFQMKFGGDVKFNPIYAPNPLKNANFVKIAGMIRAAGINFMGRSFDSAFWGNRGFQSCKVWNRLL